jgi:undecaprenyl-diphosphatase
MSGRFVGYVRPLVPFTAGAAGMRYRVFLAFSAPATAAWATGSVLLGVFFGASGERILRTFGIGAVTIATLVVAAVVAIWWVRRRRRATTRPAAASVPSESGEESRQAA